MADNELELLQLVSEYIKTRSQFYNIDDIKLEIDGLKYPVSVIPYEDKIFIIPINHKFTYKSEVNNL